MSGNNPIKQAYDEALSKVWKQMNQLQAHIAEHEAEALKPSITFGKVGDLKRVSVMLDEIISTFTQKGR